MCCITMLQIGTELEHVLASGCTFNCRLDTILFVCCHLEVRVCKELVLEVQSIAICGFLF